MDEGALALLSGSVITTVIIFIVLMYYAPKKYWREFRQSLRIDKTVMGEEALRRLQNVEDRNPLLALPQ